MNLRLPAAACRAFAVSFLLVSMPLAAKDIWDSAPLTADPKQMLAAAAAVDAKSASVVYLLNETTYSFAADGSTKTTWHLIERIATEEGASEAGTVSAWWAPWYDQKPSIEARVIGSDGVVHVLDPKAIIEATQELAQDMFSDQRVLRAPLPGVSTGSIVESVVTTIGRSPVTGGGKSGRFDFAAGVAIERSRLVLDAAAGVVPQIVNKSGIEPRVVEENGHKLTIFEKGHSDAIDEADSSTAPDDLPYPYVAFATGSSWGEIAANYSATVDAQVAASNVKDLVSKTIGNATDRAVVVEKLLDVIRKSVRYAGVEVGDGSFVPRTPSFVLQNKYGDCKDKATLLVAMLRAAGIEAHVALLAAGFGFDTVASLPAVDSFNHAIVSVDGSPAMWIDPTDEFARAAELPLEDQGRMALIASRGTTALTLTPETPASANRYIERRTFTLPEDGKAAVVEVTEGTRREDAAIRREYATAEKKAYRESIEKYETNYFAAPKIDNLEAGDPHDFSKPFLLSVTMNKSRSGVVNSGEADVLIPMYDIVTSVPASLRDYEPKSAEAENAKPEKKRTHDFFIFRPVTREWVYRIIPAAGYRAQTLPENTTTKLGTMSLTTEYSQQPDGSVVAKVDFESGKRRITPAEYDATRIAVSALARRDGVHIRFESAGQAKLTSGDIGGALAEFRKLVAAHPKEAQHHIELARTLLAGGLGEAARDEAKRAVATEPTSAKAHAMLATTLSYDLLGRQYRHGCDLPGAVAAMRKARSLDPDDMTLRAGLGELLLFGDDGYRFGHGAHLAEAAEEFRAILKDFGQEAKVHQPRLMLILAHLGKWDEVKELVKSETDVRQRDLFHLLAVTATDGSAAGLRELAAFDTNTRRSYGSAVGQTLIQFRRYSDAADFVEAASKGSDDASKSLPLVQTLRKTQLHEKLADDSPKAFFIHFMKVMATGDGKAAKALFVPEVVTPVDDSEFAFNLSTMTEGGDVRPDIVLDLAAARTDVTREGSDETGYRYRARPSGTAADTRVFYAVRRDGNLLLAGMSNVPSMIGAEALKFAGEGKLDIARTWLNWAREVVAAGGGEDPLSGPPFARLWQKDTASATADEIRAAAASLLSEKEFARDGAGMLEPLRDKAASEDAKTAIDVALARDYRLLNDWAKLTPVAERLTKAHPDSDSAFMLYSDGLSGSGKGADAEKLANERLARHPKDSAAMRALLMTMSRRGDYEAAEAWAQRLVDGATPTAGDYNDAAWVALFRGKDLQRAIEDARHATGDGNGGNAAALHTLAAVYAETGNTVEARQALLKSLDSGPTGEPRSHDWFVLGRIAETYGVSDAASAAYKRVKKEEPDGLTTWELTQRRLASLH
jgi:tetratricopeptide (TPR) repeat protein